MNDKKFGRTLFDLIAEYPKVTFFTFLTILAIAIIFIFIGRTLKVGNVEISGDKEIIRDTIFKIERETVFTEPPKDIGQRQPQKSSEVEKDIAQNFSNSPSNINTGVNSGIIGDHNTLNVNTKETQRTLSESDKNRTIQKINELIIANNKDNQVCIEIDADQGAEEYKLAKEIHDFLIKEGFNVQGGIAVTMSRLPPLEGVRMIFSKGCIEISVGYKKMFPVSTKK